MCCHVVSDTGDTHRSCVQQTVGHLTLWASSVGSAFLRSPELEKKRLIRAFQLTWPLAATLDAAARASTTLNTLRVSLPPMALSPSGISRQRLRPVRPWCEARTTELQTFPRQFCVVGNSAPLRCVLRVLVLVITEVSLFCGGDLDRPGCLWLVEI